MQSWTSQEDDRLREALILNKKGTKNWREVAAHVGTKTAHQCQQRWKNTLNPDVLRIKGRWTTEVRAPRLANTFTHLRTTWAPPQFPYRLECVCV